ncbi:MAG: YraN family protein [Gammaproteobacteria bacterium]|nr:YraN family protein [Gammaproteobacteria bacterium]
MSDLGNLSITSSKSIGERAENAAYEYLLAQGLIPISRNYRISGGEIDIILEDKDDIVFTEVRFRKHNNFGDGAESVTRKKQNRIYRTALHFIQKHPKLAKRNFRFDVISISQSGNQFTFDWIDDAFQPEES